MRHGCGMLCEDAGAARPEVRSWKVSGSGGNRRLEVDGVGGESLVGIIPFGNVAVWNTLRDLTLRNIARFGDLLLRRAGHPHVEDAPAAQFSLVPRRRPS